MGYYISYDIKGAGRRRRYFRHLKRKHIVYFLCFSLCFGLLTVSGVRQWLWDVICPGDAEVTEAALSQMVADIRNGDTVKNAVTAFCMDVLSNAK